MVDDKKIISVTNKSNGNVVYQIPELHLVREFNIGETKKIPFSELKQLSYDTGGLSLLRDELTVMDSEAVEELIGSVEPEYYYTRKEIEKLLKQGTLEELEDCLNFAPQSVVDMIKTVAVDIKLNEVNKRELIDAKTDYDINRVIELVKEANEEEIKEEKPVRRAAVAVKTEQTEAPARKASVGVVKIVK